MIMHRIAALLLGCAGFASAQAEDCAWLATSEVDRALPAQAPWQVLVGGQVGSCKFTGRGGGVLGVTQMVKGSAAEAEEFVRELRKPMEKSYTVLAAPELGKEAFSYRPKDGDGDDVRSEFFFGHHKQVAINGSLNLGQGITPETRSAAMKLMQVAFRLADDGEALAAASSCPYFDVAVLKQLLPGKGLQQQVFGSNSCMANIGTRVVLASAIEDDNPSSIAGLDDGNCSSAPIASLGPTGKVVWGCKGGRPHAKVKFASATHAYEFTLAPGVEPTDVERALLVTLAQQAYDKL